jgi:hypothetical protein
VFKNSSQRINEPDEHCVILPDSLYPVSVQDPLRGRWCIPFKSLTTRSEPRFERSLLAPESRSAHHKPPVPKTNENIQLIDAVTYCVCDIFAFIFPRCIHRRGARNGNTPKLDNALNNIWRPQESLLTAAKRRSTLTARN